MPSIWRGEMPASEQAFQMASTAMSYSDRPSDLANGVCPMPATAARSRIVASVMRLWSARHDLLSHRAVFRHLQAAAEPAGAVDDEDMAAHVGGIRRAEIRGGPAELVELSDPPSRDGPADVGVAAGSIGTHVRRHVLVRKESRCQRVHPNAERRP